MKLNSHNPRINLAKEVATAMNKRLNFADQFNSFIATAEIVAGEEATIPNHLKSKNGQRIIPGSWQVVDSRGAAAGSLGRSGTNEWTTKQLFVKNFSADNGTFTIRFFERATDE